MVEEVQEEIDRWQAAYAGDPRLTLCRVQIEAGPDNSVLSGEVLDKTTHAGLLQHLTARFSGQSFHDHVDVLLDAATRGVVHRAVASLRRDPTERSDLMSQALFNEEVSILREQEGWGLVRLCADGYLGWMPLHAVSDQASPPPTHRICVSLSTVFESPESDEVVGQLPFGAEVAIIEENKGRSGIAGPGGAVWWIAGSDRTPLLEAGESSAPADLLDALSLARRFVGIPYLWGGRSPFGFDCSGLTQTVLRFAGVQAPRDADMQSVAGDQVEGPAAPGDLLFFGRPGYTAAGIPRQGGVNHVAISLGGSDFLHASSAVWSVARGSLDPSSPVYYPGLASTLLGVRRYR